MTVYCYPTDGKRKALDVCQAFADGCGGRVVTDGRLRDGPAMFFGVNQSNVHIWRQVKADQRTYYFADNSYFDGSRQTYFRVTKNRLQHTGMGATSGERFAALKIKIEEWRDPGRAIVVCPQSDDFMKLVVEYPRDWFGDIMAALNSHKRDVHVRPWNRDKAALSKTLAQDLEGARCLVTWSSAAANTALLAGVPVVVGGTDCAAYVMSGNIYRLDELPRLDTRARWAGVLADNQWTLSEIRSGHAWEKLCA